MELLQFITSELERFVLEFPKTRVRYENDKDSETHFIEVVPNDIYHFDAQYMQWESDLFDRFVSLFPEENICFISDDALVGLDRIDFEIYGKEFVSIYSTVNSQITVLLENHIKVNSEVNNELTFNLNFCSSLIHSNFNEPKNNYCQPNTLGDNASVGNLPLAA